MYSGPEATAEIITWSASFLNILRRQEMTTLLKDWTTVREEGGHLDSRQDSHVIRGQVDLSYLENRLHQSQCFKHWP